MDREQSVLFPIEDTEQAVATRFERQVERYPTRVAVIDGQAEVSYEELNRRANRVARALPDPADGGAKRVAIYLEKGVAYLAAIMGVLKSGHAYVPLDPTFPRARNSYIVNDAAAEVILTDERYLAEVGEFGPESAAVIRIDALLVAESAAEDEENLGRSISPDALSYIIYTSGSTGKPKGVMQNQRNLLHGCMRRTNLQRVTADDRMTLFYSCSVMGSVYCIFGALLNGAVLLPYDIRAEGLADLAQWLTTHRVTIWHSVASVFRSFSAVHEGSLAGNEVRLVIFGGERVLTTDVAGARRVFSEDVVFFTGLGSTETGTVRHLMITRDVALDARVVPIGYPVEGVTIVLTDEDGKPVPQGSVGEINVHSRYIALGYWNNPEATQKVFSEVPGEPGVRCYRMGDMAQLHPDGMLEHKGRRDFQIKIRGFRVEIGEVESALHNHPRLADGVVKAVEIGNELELVAYVVIKEDASAPRVTVRQLREFLRELLPSYMVPTRYVALAALPRTPNNKVDKLSLPAPVAANALPQEECQPPGTDTERRLLTVCAKLLRRTVIGVNDNFFDLGGDSLLATQLVSAIQAEFDVRLSMRSIFDARDFVALSREVDYGGSEPVVSSSIDTGSRPERIPATPAQRRMWLIDRMNSGGAAYNISNAVLLSGPLDAAALDQAINQIAERHEILRTVFEFDEDGCFQRVLPYQRFALPLIDLSQGDLEQARSRARALVQEHLAQRQDLARGPLWHCALIKVRSDEHVLSLVFNHIIYDNIWSSRLLFRELSAAYAFFRDGAGGEAPLPTLPIQFADYALWEDQRVRAGGFEEHLEFWRQELRDLPEPLELRGDRPRPDEPTFAGGQVVFSIPVHLRLALADVGRSESTTAFMMLLAAWQLLLARYCGQRDIIVGTPTGRRERSETDQLIGLFINNLALRARIAENLTFRQLLAHVRRTCVEAFSHDELPFEELVAALRPPRTPGVSPLFQHFFIHRNSTHAAWEIDGLQVEPLRVHAGAAKFDLTLSVLETEHRLSATIEYSADLFEHQTIENMAANYVQVLQSALENLDQSVWTLALPSSAEQERILRGWNQTARDYPQHKRTHDLIAEVASADPDRVAVVGEQESLTYGELDRRAHALARRLQSQGMGPGDLVGVCLERSPTLVVALLAVMKSGAAYVPLDPDFPAERLSFMVDNSQARVVIADSATVSRLPDSDALVLLVDGATAVEQPRELHPGRRASADDLVYVIYTSGSTGRPKGVQVTHRGLLNFLLSMGEQPGIAKDDVMQALTTVCFDIAALELFLPLLVGAKVVISGREVALSPEKLKQSLSRHGVTLMQATPITWRLLLESGWSGQPQLKVLCGGEAMGVDLAEQLLATGHEIWNLYGPTETTVWSTAARVSEREDARFVGTPIANTELYVTNRQLAPQPIGVPGELLIGGDGLARGYLGLDEMTRERFVDSPFIAGKRVYRTGDLVVRHANGSLEFLGRMDNQVKIRGFRIELGEIESHLASHPSIKQVVVIAREDTPGDKRLVAYCVATNAGDLEAKVLNEHLRAALPSYMLPAGYVSLEEFPLTPNGKVDRKRLPKPATLRASSTGSDRANAQRKRLENRLSLLWEAALGCDGLTIDDDFFALGGDSMLALRLLSDMRSALGLNVAPAALFEARTIRRLVDQLEGTGGAHFGVVRLNAAITGAPVYCLSGVKPFLSLARQLASNPVFALFSPHELASIEAHRQGLRQAVPLNDVVQWYTEAVLRHGNSRPLTLVGYATSGLVALEVAARLQQRAVTVERVVILSGEQDTAGDSMAALLERYVALAADRGVVLATRELARRLTRGLADEVNSLGARGSLARRRRDLTAQRQAASALCRAITLRPQGYDVDVVLLQAAGLGYDETVDRSQPDTQTDHAVRLERQLRQAVRGRVEVVRSLLGLAAHLSSAAAPVVVSKLSPPVQRQPTTSA